MAHGKACAQENMKIINKIKTWYQGKRVEVSLPKGIIGIPIVHYVQPPLARFLKAIGHFWLKHWKWIITTAIAIMSAYIGYIALQ